MRIRIEEHPPRKIKYYVLDFGRNKIALDTCQVKSILLLWVFFAAVFFAYNVGKMAAIEEAKFFMFMAKGNVTDEKGNPVYCDLVRQENRLEWRCYAEERFG
jgi:hypothetical protein